MTDRNNMQIQSCILDLHTPVLTGPRQVGKTTLLTKMAGKDRKLVYSGLAYLGAEGLLRLTRSPSMESSSIFRSFKRRR